MRKLWPLLAAAALAACAGSRDATISKEVEENVRASESKVVESRTLVSLAKIEESIAAFVNGENRIPAKLDELVPKYLAEIPSIEVGVRGHGETTQVKYYPASALRDGQIDGSQLKDSGKWGYVHNDRQVVVFIDCTHVSPRRQPWYKEHGAH